MDNLIRLPPAERKTYFEASRAKIGIIEQIIEKDFWVCWVMKRLFSLQEYNDIFTFKGGTSLSKVFGLIERFSEDVDILVDKNFLGFSGKNDPEQAPSAKKQKAQIEKLADACKDFVQGPLVKVLRDEIEKYLPDTTTWKVELDTTDPDGQTILFVFPDSGIQQGSGYLKPQIKIELGARSDDWPMSVRTIHPYLKDAFPESLHAADVHVRVIDAERTFWEKSVILHRYAHFPFDRTAPARQSRHFYDFYCMLNSGIKASALLQKDLLKRVATHTDFYFRTGWANYSKARLGTLKLVPSERILKMMEHDYEQMSVMFFGKERPKWEQILKDITIFEKEINSLS